MRTIDMIGTGKNIRSLMDKSGITVSNVQEKMGFKTPQAIYKWLHGTSLPTIDNLIILEDVLGVSMDEIIITNKAREGGNLCTKI